MSNDNEILFTMNINPPVVPRTYLVLERAGIAHLVHNPSDWLILRLSENSTYSVSQGYARAYFEDYGSEPLAVVGWQWPDHLDVEQPESEINALIEDLRRIVSGWHIRSLEEIGGPWKHQFDESAVQAYANIQSNLEVPF